jgi:Hemerythrin HHE cation binding domain
MGIMIESGRDVVGFLKNQHQLVKSMFDEVLAAHGEQREKAFYALRRLLAVHETAEEEIVHPAARSALPNGGAIIEERLREENEAKKALAKIEELDVDSVEFEADFRALKASVIAHAESEEAEEFERLAGKLDPKRLERMQKAAEFAESVAPTRPHAGVESRAANLLVGPFAAMLDRSRDALSRKTAR